MISWHQALSRNRTLSSYVPREPNVAKPVISRPKTPFSNGSRTPHRPPNHPFVFIVTTKHCHAPTPCSPTDCRPGRSKTRALQSLRVWGRSYRFVQLPPTRMEKLPALPVIVSIRGLSTIWPHFEMTNVKSVISKPSYRSKVGIPTLETGLMSVVHELPLIMWHMHSDTFPTKRRSLPAHVATRGATHVKSRAHQDTPPVRNAMMRQLPLRPGRELSLSDFQVWT